MIRPPRFVTAAAYYRPSPLDLPGALAAKLGLQSIAPCGAPSAPFPRLFGVGGLEGTLPMHSSLPHGTLRAPCSGLGRAPKPDYHLDFYLTPRSFRVCPLGPFPGLSPQPDPNSPLRGVRTRYRRLLTRRESAVPPPVRRRGIQPVRGLHDRTQRFSITGRWFVESPPLLRVTPEYPKEIGRAHV